MNSAAEFKRQNDSASLEKAKNKIITALENDPLGLSVSQLMTVCRLGIKTVKEALATMDIDQEEGVYFLKNKTIEAKPIREQPAVAKNETQDEPEDTGKRRVGLQSELLQLLQCNKDGLPRSIILETLDVTEKQFGKALWELRKNHEIIRTGDFNSLHYQLGNTLEKEALELVEVVDTKSDPTLQVDPVTGGDKEISVLDKARSRIKTVVTTKCELDLSKEDLTDLLVKLFGLGQVEWKFTDGELVGVGLCKIEEVLQ